ncbi:hypothetical protein OAQ99_03060 [Candidatus Kapabacteria bacterium]|nr:hypothetical protein [Candidatus Kapabacteria bacterium]
MVSLSNRLETVATANPLEFNQAYSYDAIGRMQTRTTVTQDEWHKTKKQDEFEYSHNNLLYRYLGRKAITQADCDPVLDQNDANEWRYRYSPYGERERKRMYNNYKISDDYLPQMYYLLDDNNRQISLYQGVETSLDQFAVTDDMGVSSTFHNTNMYDVHLIDSLVIPSWYSSVYEQDNRYAYMYPAEYNLHSGSNKDISYVYEDEQAQNWDKEYNITDYLGNLRMTLKADQIELKPQLAMDYSPYGGVFWSENLIKRFERTRDINQRDNWVGKEKDKENGLGDHGVRKYDHLIGRFNSIDPLWGKYLGWTPYQYSANSPVHLVDLDGNVVVYAQFEVRGAATVSQGATSIGIMFDGYTVSLYNTWSIGSGFGLGGATGLDIGASFARNVNEMYGLGWAGGFWASSPFGGFGFEIGRTNPEDNRGNWGGDISPPFIPFTGGLGLGVYGEGTYTYPILEFNLDDIENAVDSFFEEAENNDVDVEISRDELRDQLLREFRNEDSEYTSPSSSASGLNSSSSDEESDDN